LCSKEPGTSWDGKKKGQKIAAGEGRGERGGGGYEERGGGRGWRGGGSEEVRGGGEGSGKRGEGR